MKVLVTGGAGFIGSNFVRYMLKTYTDYKIINFDSLTYAGNLDNLHDVETNSNYQFVKGDITHPTDVERVVACDVDVIVNFAAETHVDRSILAADTFIRTNLMGTQVLLEAVRKYGVKKYIQVSTDEVYGTLGLADAAFTEETPLLPNSPYSASKAGADLLVRAYHETYQLPVNITRCSNNYGPYQFPEKLIPLMILHAVEDKPLPVYGDGLQIRDWLHVWDHCAALDRVLHHGRPGEVYNIGGNNEHTNIEVVRVILELLGKPESLIRYVTDRPGHDRRYAINANKIRTELAWQPKYTFDSGIEETVKWYLAHQPWWTAIRDKSYMTYYETQYKDRLGS